jgi:hypothetical protein
LLPSFCLPGTLLDASISKSITMADLEKDHAPGTNGNGNYHMDESIDSETALRKIRTAGSISISPELFEKIYLSPKNQVSNNLRSTFGNPTPLYGCSKIWTIPNNLIDVQCSRWFPSFSYTSIQRPPRLERSWRPRCSRDVSGSSSTRSDNPLRHCSI